MSRVDTNRRPYEGGTARESRGRGRPGSSLYSPNSTGDASTTYRIPVTLPRLHFLGDEVSDMLDFARQARDGAPNV